MPTVFITGADRGVGFSLCECFLRGGWRVLAGQFMPQWTALSDLKAANPDRVEIVPLDVSSTESVQNAAKRAGELCGTVDLLVSCAGIANGDDYSTTKAVFNVNAVGAVRVVEAFLPLMQDGLKRFAFVSSEAGCVSLAHRDGGFAYTTSKTALNMAVRRIFRSLQPAGYTVRLYHPGWVRSYMSGKKSSVGNFEPEEAAETAYRQFTADREAEDVLVMTDVSDEMWPY
ncbi:MAG: SDR family NAD(P)-dependent oxidoreductase [Eubacteriales bacterium]|nr:SDR family NAD(P)-dependent oxidoreductase [Eubacteriales bacterium]